MENVVVTVPSADLAAAYTLDFEQLWQKQHVGTGTFDDAPAALTFEGAPAVGACPLLARTGARHGPAGGGQAGCGQERIRICSPVLTSGPILATLSEVLDDKRCPMLVTVDGPQMAEALKQWEADGRAAWKAPLYQKVAASGFLAAKPSVPFQAPPPHNYMHAKLVVCDDWVLTGSYNCSHSGELNAENLLEIRSRAFADRCATFCEQVHSRLLRRRRSAECDHRRAPSARLKRRPERAARRPG